MSRFTNPPRSFRSSESATAVQSTTSLPLPQRLLSSNPSVPLPPLIKTAGDPSPDITALNEQLYLFLAFSLRAFVLPWWSKLSPRDKEFLPQITIVAQAVIEDIHRRLLHADLVSLLAVKLPLLIQQHYSDYKHARRKLGTSFATTPPTSLDEVFHRLQPHIALSGEDDALDLIDPMYLRTAVDHIIKACLPPSDAGSDLERTILREILVGPVLGTTLPKLAQPWFLHQIFLNLLGYPQSGKDGTRPPSSRPFTLNNLIILFLTTIQTISTVCLNLIHMSQNLYHLAQAVNPKIPGRRTSVSPSSHQGLLNPSLWALREVLDLDQPNYTGGVTAKALFNTTELLGGLAEPFTDRLIPHLLNTHVLTAAQASNGLAASIRTLFPETSNYYPGPPPPIPTQEEQAALRESLESRISELLPFPLKAARTPSLILDPLSSARCNAHLIILLLDLLILTLFPELELGAAATEDAWAAGEDADSSEFDAADARGYDTPESSLKGKTR